MTAAARSTSVELQRLTKDSTSPDRQAIHDWLLSLKQPDGSFVMHKGGEVDVR